MIRRCTEGDVPCGPICSIEDIFNEEQFWVRGTLTRVKDERLRELAVQGPMPKLSETPGEIKHLGTTSGRHNQEIFAALLGMSEDDIDSLKADDVV